MALPNLLRWALNAMGRLRMQQGLIQLEVPPLQHQEFHSLPAGFEYSNKISEASKRTGFAKGVIDRDLERCVVCGFRQSVNRVHVIKQSEGDLVSKIVT